MAVWSGVCGGVEVARSGFIGCALDLLKVRFAVLLNAWEEEDIALYYVYLNSDSHVLDN